MRLRKKARSPLLTIVLRVGDDFLAIWVVVASSLFLRAEAGSRPGGRGTCSLLRQRKVPKRKATPSPCPRSPVGRTGQPAMLGPGVVPQNSLRSPFGRTPFRQLRRVSARSMRAPTRMPPRSRPAAGAASRGWTAEQPHGPLLRSAWWSRRKAPARSGAERSDGPCGCWLPQPFWLRRGGQCGGRAGAVGHTPSLTDSLRLS